MARTYYDRPARSGPLCRICKEPTDAKVAQSGMLNHPACQDE